LGVLPNGLFAFESQRSATMASLPGHAVIADRIRTTKSVIGREPKSAIKRKAPPPRILSIFFILSKKYST